MAAVKLCNTFDVVIVGAGISGLYCAKCLTVADATLKVAVVEARSRVGGRALTHMLDTHALDMGGQWVGPTEKLVLDLVNEVGLSTRTQIWPERREGGPHVAGASPALCESVGLPVLQPNEAAEFLSICDRMDELSASVPLHAPWKAPEAAVWDTMTVDDYITRNAQSQSARKEMQMVVQTLTAAEPREISFLYWLWFVRTAGGLSKLDDGKDGGQHFLINGGMQQVMIRLSQRIQTSNKVCFFLGEPVRKISQRENVVTIDTSRSVLQARRVVVALSPSLVLDIAFDPPLPVGRQCLGQHAVMGCAIKVFCVYRKAFWHEHRSGSKRPHLAPGVIPGPVLNIFEMEINQQPALLGLIVGDFAREMSQLPKETLACLVMHQYASLFDHVGQADAIPDHVVIRRWTQPTLTKPTDDFSHAPLASAFVTQFAKLPPPPNALSVTDIVVDALDSFYSRGCYANVFPPKVLTSVGSSLMQPVGRVHWAGTETSTEWNGHFEGGASAGKRAAIEVLHALDSSNAETMAGAAQARSKL